MAYKKSSYAFSIEYYERLKREYEESIKGNKVLETEYEKAMKDIQDFWDKQD